MKEMVLKSSVTKEVISQGLEGFGSKLDGGLTLFVGKKPSLKQKRIVNELQIVYLKNSQGTKVVLYSTIPPYIASGVVSRRKWFLPSTNTFSCSIMDFSRFAVAFILLSFATNSLSERLIRMPTEDRGVSVHSGVPSSRKNQDLLCESWKFSVETNDAGVWYTVPEKCVTFVTEYLNGERYRSDSEVIADYALEYAKTVNIAGDGKDAWIFDIDETLLSNMPWYASHGFGSEVFDEVSFNEWVDVAEAPALPASLRLYTQLQQLGFKIFLLTGRSESQRECTDKNLLYSGYTNYQSLILRGSSDVGKAATLYKSERRQGLIDEGYRIHGNSGDQWSDLLGFAVGKRSFKLPNPMYWIA
ncbi:hypothetical protein LXL04_002476 [Taraxacum kok-saghyz]